MSGERSHQWNPGAVADDELLSDFSKVPTVHRTEAEEDPDETRRALAVLVDQALRAGASREEIEDAVRALRPGSWGTAKNKNELRSH
jgi:hypothetical protein